MLWILDPEPDLVGSELLLLLDQNWKIFMVTEPKET